MAAFGACIAIMHDGKVLLTKREDFEVWCLPGGHLEDGESLAGCALREAREETGLEVELTGLVGTYSRIGGLRPDVHLALFTARPIGGELRRQTDETVDARFFGPDAVPDDLFLGHKQRITDVLTGVRGVAWTQKVNLPPELHISRQELYERRDRSGLSRSEFYREYFRRQATMDDILEVGPANVSQE